MDEPIILIVKDESKKKTLSTFIPLAIMVIPILLLVYFEYTFCYDAMSNLFDIKKAIIMFLFILGFGGYTAIHLVKSFFDHYKFK